jgi:hypothetical protein
MQRGLDSLLEKRVFAACTSIPRGRTTVSLKWVYKIKYLPIGQVKRYKSRLVAQGYTQRAGIDYMETFSPTVRMESLRTIIAVSTQQDYDIKQLDVQTAYLNSELKEKVYCTAPDGFAALLKSDITMRLVPQELASTTPTREGSTACSSSKVCMD